MSHPLVTTLRGISLQAYTCTWIRDSHWFSLLISHPFSVVAQQAGTLLMCTFQWAQPFEKLEKMVNMV